MSAPASSEAHLVTAVSVGPMAAASSSSPIPSSAPVVTLAHGAVAVINDRIAAMGEEMETKKLRIEPRIRIRALSASEMMEHVVACQTQDHARFPCPVCGGHGYWCRGCTRGLQELPLVLRIRDWERERIYQLIQAECGDNFVPCLVCNRQGCDPPTGERILNDFWQGFQVNFVELAGRRRS